MNKLNKQTYHGLSPRPYPFPGSRSSDTSRIRSVVWGASRFALTCTRHPLVRNGGYDNWSRGAAWRPGLAPTGSAFVQSVPPVPRHDRCAESASPPLDTAHHCGYVDIFCSRRYPHIHKTLRTPRFRRFQCSKEKLVRVPNKCVVQYTGTTEV